MEGSYEVIMLTYSNTQRYLNMPWREYAALHGYSYSFLKKEKFGASPYFVPTDKMKLGSLVDAILMQQDEVDMRSPLFPHAKIIAGAILSEFSSLIKQFTSQVSYSGILSCDGLSIPTKGRPDWEIPKVLMVDLKITEATDIKALITYMGYDNQQNHYCGLAGIPVAYILAYNPKLKRTLPIISLPYSPDNEFWKEKVMKFGTLAA